MSNIHSKKIRASFDFYHQPALMCWKRPLCQLEETEINLTVQLCLTFLIITSHVWIISNVYISEFYWLTKNKDGRVTNKKSPNVYKSWQKLISLEKWKFLKPSQKLYKNVGDLGKIIVATGFEKLPKVQ